MGAIARPAKPTAAAKHAGPDQTLVDRMLADRMLADPASADLTINRVLAAVAVDPVDEVDPIAPDPMVRRCAGPPAAARQAQDRVDPTAASTRSSSVWNANLIRCCANSTS
jgi:hypothetical protein